jgi:preprotein translocase subunit YajC
MFVTPAYAQAAGSTPDIFISILPFVLIFVIMYLLIIRPQRAQMKKRTEMLTAIRRGDTVVTGGGLVGKVTKVNDDNELEVDLGGMKVTALQGDDRRRAGEGRARRQRERQEITAFRAAPDRHCVNGRPICCIFRAGRRSRSGRSFSSASCSSLPNVLPQVRSGLDAELAAQPADDAGSRPSGWLSHPARGRPPGFDRRAAAGGARRYSHAAARCAHRLYRPFRLRAQRAGARPRRCQRSSKAKTALKLR